MKLVSTIMIVLASSLLLTMSYPERIEQMLRSEISNEMETEDSSVCEHRDHVILMT
jgi:hypothetical protein